MKECIICNLSKDLLDFKKDKRRVDGFTNTCKVCMSKKGLEYYYRTKDERKDTINKNRRQSYQLNKDKENIRSNEYKKKNKEIINEYTRSYINNRLKNDSIFRLKHYIRSMIGGSIRRKGFTKKTRTYEVLGCSYEEFKIYLESKFEPWMDWDNQGFYNGELNYGWDIDHIIPLSSAETEEDVIILNHYTNFQPLCSYTNRYIKKDNY